MKVVQHTVRAGENLSFIADCYDVSWRALYTYNRDAIGTNPDLLQIGTKLTIPPATYQAPEFRYTPTARPGILPAGLSCPPDSPKATAGDC